MDGCKDVNTERKRHLWEANVAGDSRDCHNGITDDSTWQLSHPVGQTDISFVKAA